MDELRYEQSPLGITPRHIWEGQRMTELIKAMNRYIEAGKNIPRHWVEEFNELSMRKENV